MVEVSGSESVLWKGAFYIECLPNYVGGDKAKFEFLEWETWATNYDITLLEVDKADSQTE